MYHVLGRGEVHFGLWWEIMKEKFGRPRCRWTFKLDLRNVECMSMVWIDLALNRYGWRAL